jgi:glycosyltransferase involved in cell wall biosynthesis
MRILAITGRLPTSDNPGSMASVARQIASLRSAGVTVETLEIAGTNVVKYLEAMPRMSRSLKAFDLVHAHYGYCGWIARSQFLRPVVISFMGDDLLGTPNLTGKTSVCSRLIAWGNRLFARTVDAVIVKSAQMAGLVAPTKPYIIPNGVDLDIFRPVDTAVARRELGWEEGKQYVLFPGCPETPRKNYPLAQAVVEQVTRWTEAPVQLKILWGVPPERVPLYMNASGALLTTSFLEGSPNTVKEAMACNLPVVSVPVGDVPELLKGVEGCVVAPYDVGALAEGLIQILNIGRRSVGRAAIVRKGLTQEGVARRIVQVYESVLTKRGQSPAS